MRELSLNVLDIVQNSVSAGASLIEIGVTESAESVMTIRISDNGCGMDAQQLRSVADPFYTTRTTRKVGMGIPLYRMAAEQTGGSLQIESQKGAGTCVTATFHTDSIDCAPLGDMASTMCVLIGANESVDFVYTHETPQGSFTLDTRALREMMQGVPLSEPEVLNWIRDYIREQTEMIGGGALSFEND